MAFNQLKKSYGNIVRKGFFLRSLNRSLFNTSTESCILFALIGDISEAKLIINKIVNLQKKLSVPITVSVNRNTSSFKHIQKIVVTSGLRVYDPVNCGLPIVCFFRSSSVAIEYMRRGVYLVYLDLNEPISNNTFDLDSSFNVENLDVNDLSYYTLSKHLKKREAANWSKIASYFLDESFSAQDLKQLIIT